MAQRDVVAPEEDRDQLVKLLTLHEIALGTMAHGLCMYDADQRVVLYNRSFVEHYDLSPEALRRGMTMRDVFLHAATRLGLTAEQLEASWRRRQERLAAGHAFTDHHRLPDGRTIALQFRPMPGGGWVAVYEDVTTQKDLERQLRQQFGRMQLAVGSMSHGLCMFDADERLIVCNERYLELYDLDPDVVKPGVTHREVLEHWISRGNQPGSTVEQFYAERMRLVRGDGAQTMRLVRADGRVIEATSRPTPDGGWVTAHEDVTVRLRQQEALSEQNLRFDAALNNMSQGLAMFDSEHRLTVYNERYLEIFGMTAEQTPLGTSLRELFGQGVAAGLYPGQTVEELLARRLAVVSQRSPVCYDQKIAGGRTVAIAICPMANGGWVGTFDDVTESRKVEAERATALERLREQNARFDAAVNNMSQGLAMFDAEHRLIVCNDKYLAMFRADPAVVKPGASMLEIFQYGVAMGAYPPGATAEELLARRMAAFAERRLVVYDQTLADGSIIEVATCPMANGGWVGTYEDVTERRRVEAERAAALESVREQHNRFNAALDHMSHGLCMYDENQRLIACNKRYIDMFGLSPGIVKPGVSMREVMAHSVERGNYPGQNADALYEAYLERIRSGAVTVRRHLPDGRIIQILHRPMAHGGWVGTYEDITERHRSEERISHMARHDALTGLPNRLLFREKMAEGLAQVEAGGARLALICLDLDHFKTVNDTLGHPVGDQLLAMVAQRLVCVVDPGDTISRLGGDEFAILKSLHGLRAAGALARRIVEVLCQPMTIDGHEINAGVSIGIAVAPDDGTTADHLMKCADLALYRAKADGRGRFRFFEPDMDRRLQGRRSLEADLRKALAAGEFELFYQPQVRAADCAIGGMEALLRWNHPERGRVAPGEFIPMAEETGLITPIGEWVLRRACAEAARWPASIRVAVNLSPAQFKSRGLVATVAGALAAAGLSPTRLELEITEAVLLKEDDLTLAMLHQLRALGVRISMDDFGTGYSSLSYLRSFPFDKIKIDRSFIADLDRGRDSAAIIRAIAGLGASLGIETTAEGVETAEQFEHVRRDGCTEIQGNYFSPPRPAAEALDLIARWRREKAVA